MSQAGIGWNPLPETETKSRVEEPAPEKRSWLDLGRAGAWGQGQGSGLELRELDGYG